MATVITSECINCGACESECPNTAIYQGGVEWELDGVTHPAIAADIFYIVPDKCTECVGFFDHEACAAVCPVDCCIPDPNIPEIESVLIERARKLHPDQAFATDFPSRFRKEGGAPTAEPPTTPATAAPPPAPKPVTTAPAPVTATPPPAPPAAAAKAEPAPTATAVAPAAPVAETSLAIPEIEEWEVPIDCFRCHGTYAVAFKHFRSGVVFYCPFCSGSYVITTSMHNHVHHQLRDFHQRWRQEFETFQAKRQRELTAFEDKQRRALEEFNASLRLSGQELKPPGAPRKRAWIFG